VDARVRHQVGLELGDIDVKGTVEAERSRQGRHHLGDQTVKIGVGGSLDVEVAAADVVQGLVIQAEGAIGVLKQGVRREHVIVRLDNSRGHLGGRSHGEGELGLAAVIDGKALEEKRAETRASSSTSGVEDHEALETSAIVSKLADAVEDKVDDFLADGVMTAGVVVGSIFLARDNLLRVVELSVGASADLIADGGLQIKHHAAGNVLAGTSFREKGVEGVISAADGLIRRHLAIGLDSVLKAIKFPAGIARLDSCLTDMN